MYIHLVFKQLHVIVENLPHLQEIFDNVVGSRADGSQDNDHRLEGAPELLMMIHELMIHLPYFRGKSEVKLPSILHYEPIDCGQSPEPPSNERIARLCSQSPGHNI